MTRPRRRRRPVPAGASPLEAARLILRGATFPVAARVAAVVGTILTAVDQATVIVAGDAKPAAWLRTGANFAVPYGVSSIGYLSPFRTDGHGPSE